MNHQERDSSRFPAFLRLGFVTASLLVLSLPLASAEPILGCEPGAGAPRDDAVVNADPDTGNFGIWWNIPGPPNVNSEFREKGAYLECGTTECLNKPPEEMVRCV